MTTYWSASREVGQDPQPKGEAPDGAKSTTTFNRQSMGIRTRGQFPAASIAEPGITLPHPNLRQPTSGLTTLWRSVMPGKSARNKPEPHDCVVLTGTLN